jgi:hypothetical protein
MGYATPPTHTIEKIPLIPAGDGSAALVALTEPRLQPVRTRLLLAMLSFLVVGAGERVLVEDEPAARAPLPPPLPFTASEPRRPQGQAQVFTLAPKRGQIIADAPSVKLYRDKQRAHASSHHGTPAAAAGGRAHRPHEVLVKTAPTHRSGHGLAYNGNPERSRSQAGHLSPPNEYRGSPSDSAATASTGPLAGPVSRYYIFPGPPISDFGPGYSPYRSPPPGPGFYR